MFYHFYTTQMKLDSSLSKISGKYLKIAIILSRFNDSLGKILLENTEETLMKDGVQKKDIRVIRVPGALEIPLTAKFIAEQKKYDAIVALGIVVKGETAHFEHVCAESHRGLMNVQLKTKTPIIFGIITALNKKQVIDRIEKNKLNKGKEFAESAIEMACIRQELEKG